MIMKIVIISMERMRTKDDVLHLGHSGSAGRPRGTVCLHTTTGETGGGLRPARGNTHYLQSHTHNSNTRARVSQPLLIWFKHNYIHGALLFYFNPSSTCLHFPNFSNTFSPSSQLLTATYQDLANFPIVSNQGHFCKSYQSRYCTVSTFWLVAAEGVVGAPSCWLSLVEKSESFKKAAAAASNASDTTNFLCCINMFLLSNDIHFRRLPIELGGPLSRLPTGWLWTGAP